MCAIVGVVDYAGRYSTTELGNGRTRGTAHVAHLRSDIRQSLRFQLHIETRRCGARSGPRRSRGYAPCRA